jgi:hypothetical protein
MVVHEPRLGFHTHITPGEWAEYVKPRDAKGGSFNRLLPVLVEGSKVLPYGHRELYPEIAGLLEAYDWARRSRRVMSLDKSAARRFDELRVLFLDKLTDMAEYQRCYVERTPEQILRVAAVLTAAERRTTVSRKAIDAAWAFVQYSMRSVERLVRGDGQESSGRRVPKTLPELIREIMTRYEGEVRHSDMLRCLGVRATARSLRKALESMPDIQVVTGVSETGRGRPGTVYRWATEPPADAEHAEVPEQTPEAPAETASVSVPEERELVLSGGWL